MITTWDGGCGVSEVCDLFVVNDASDTNTYYLDIRLLVSAAEAIGYYSVCLLLCNTSALTMFCNAPITSVTAVEKFTFESTVCTYMLQSSVMIVRGT